MVKRKTSAGMQTITKFFRTANTHDGSSLEGKSCISQRTLEQPHSSQTASSSHSRSKSLQSSQSDVQSGGDHVSHRPETVHENEREMREKPYNSSKSSDQKQSVVKSSPLSQIATSSDQSQSHRAQVRDGQSPPPSTKSSNQSVNTDSAVDQSQLPKSGSCDHPKQSDAENCYISTGCAISSDSSFISSLSSVESTLKCNKDQLSEKSCELKNEKKSTLTENTGDSNQTSIVSHVENEILSDSNDAALNNSTSNGTINESSLLISPEKIKELQNLFLNNSPLLKKKLRTGEGVKFSEDNSDKTQARELHFDTKQQKKTAVEGDLELISPLPVDNELKGDLVDGQETCHLECELISTDIESVIDGCESDKILDVIDLAENVEHCENVSTSIDPQISIETSSDPVSNSLPKFHVSPFKISQSSAVDIQRLFKNSPVLKNMVNQSKSRKAAENFIDMPILVRVNDLNEEKVVVNSSKKVKTISQVIGEKQEGGGATKVDIYNLYDSDEIDLESDFGESDDDDELVAAPSFLQSLVEASKPLQATPEKLSQHRLEISQLDDSQLEMPVLELQIPITSQFSLDQMLAEKIEKADELRKHKEMQTELKEHLRQGGFIKLTLEKPEEIQEDEMSLEQDQQQLLKNFQVSESTIMEVHPGDPVFHAQNYGQLFTDSLKPRDCGFQPGNSYVDGLLVDIQPADYDIVLTSDALFDCLDSVSCQSAVLRWLFFIMSIHNSHLIMEGCRQILCEAIHIQLLFHKLPKTWAPTVQDVLTVFVNYGGDLDELLPESGLVSHDLRATISENDNNQMIVQGDITKFSRENMRRVITVINVSLQARPQYSNEELTTLFKIFSKAALDISLNNHCLDYEFSLCLASVLQLYSDKDWSQQALHLVWILANRTSSHHNQVHLLQLLMPNSRTSYLRQRTSFILLQQMLFDRDEISEEELVDLKLSKLLRMVPVMRDYAHRDLYTLASMVNLLDICVGNDVLKSAEKDDMRTLTDQLKKLTSEVRDNVHMLDCTRIKDMMVRVSSKWTLVMQATGCKQKSIFAYARHQDSPFMKIEALQAHQSDQSDQSDDEDDIKTNSKLIRNQKEGETNIASENMTAVSLTRGEDLVKVGTDAVEEMDFAESFDYSDEDILPDI